MDQRLDAIEELAVAQLLADRLRADEPAYSDLREHRRIEVGAHRALGLRRREVLSDRVEPGTNRATHLVAEVRVSRQFLDELAQRGRSLALLGVPGDQPRRREQPVDGLVVVADFGADPADPSLLVVSDDGEGKRLLGREVEVEAALGQSARLDDPVERGGRVAIANEGRQCGVQDGAPSPFAPNATRFTGPLPGPGCHGLDATNQPVGLSTVGTRIVLRSGLGD